MPEIKPLIKSILWMFFKCLVPIEQFIALFKRPVCLTTESQLADLEGKIKDNDVLFSKLNWELSNLCIVGTYTHVAIYRNGLVYEAVTEGVRSISLREWFFQKDHVGLARCNMFTPNADQLATGLAFLVSCLGESYDYDFVKFTRKSQFCSAYWYAYMTSMLGTAFTTWFPKPLIFDSLPYLTPVQCWNQLDKVVQYN